MKHLKISALSAAILVAAMIVPAVAIAAAPTVSARAGSLGVELAPSQSAPAWQLRVSAPDGKVGQAEFLGNETLLIEPRLFGATRWTDGSYRYEIVPVLGDRQRGEGNQGAPAAIAAARPLSGTFAVIGGRIIVAGKGNEAPRRAAAVAAAGGVTPQDIVNPDDFIVQGSACVGLDCVDGEAFGFDSLRLKENNTQIGFDDTSTSAGFPSNDWALVANEAASGGASRFFLRDVTGGNAEPFSVAAGAGTGSLFVDSTGRIGLGTTVPTLKLQLTQGDTPAIRLEQTSTSGFTAQTWDVAGNEANFFVRDLTGGSRLPFRIRPGAPTSSIDIAASGNVGIGTSSPATALHVVDDGSRVSLRLTATSGLQKSWDIYQNTATGRLDFTDDLVGNRVPVKFGAGAVTNLLRVGLPATNVVEVNGNLNVNGNIRVTGSVGPDYVFGPGFALPSIGDHAQYMLANHHLPKVGAAQVNEAGQGVMDLGTLSHGMLEELEYAHLYIAQLDGTVQELRAAVAARDAEMAAREAQVAAREADVARRDAELAELRAEVREIRAMLSD